MYAERIWDVYDGRVELLSWTLVKHMKHGTFLSQTKYCTELIKKFGMKKCKETSTLMATSTYLDLDEKGKSVDESRYRGMIWSLLYLVIDVPSFYSIF